MCALIMFMTVLYTMMNNVEPFLFLPYPTFLVRFFQYFLVITVCLSSGLSHRRQLRRATSHALISNDGSPGTTSPASPASPVSPALISTALAELIQTVTKMYFKYCTNHFQMPSKTRWILCVHVTLFITFQKSRRHI